MALAAVIGCFAAGLLTLIFFITFIGNLFTFAPAAPALQANSILRIDMSAISFAEKKEAVDLQAYLQGDMLPSVTLWDALKAIKRAEADPMINFIFLKADGINADIAQVEELRAALAEFRRSSGKAVVSFCEFPSLGSYYLASVSDKIYLSANMGAGPQINGVATQMFFLGDLLNKLDVNVQLIRHGKFKSAGEMFIKSEPSAENLLQTREMIGSLWKSVAEDIAMARGVDAGDFVRLVEGLGLGSCQDMIDNNLADELLSRQELKEKLANLSGVESYDLVHSIDLENYVRLRSGGSYGRNRIAILVASGDIVEGIDESNIAGDAYATTIARLRDDDNVKAVVLRVSSPGGSVLASDKIKTELDLLKEKKPVIASYGAYAASGGYWISNGCDRIFTDKTTITGSIGVFAMIPDFSRTIRNKLHVNVVTVGSTSHNGGVFAPLDTAEKEALQAQIEEIYQGFVNTVASGRGMDPAAVDEIAQGRVWTGADAIGLGLADEAGTLMDAVRYAASLVGDPDLSAWNIRTYPVYERTIIDELVDSFGAENTGAGDVFADTPVRQLEYTLKRWYRATSQARFFARLPYEIVIQ